MTDRAYREQVKRLAAVFDAVPTSREKSEEMIRSLGGIPTDHLALVVDRIIDTRTSGFMPTPAEVKGAYVAMILGPEDPDGSLQWCLAEHKRIASRQEADYWAADVLTRGLFRPKPELPERYPDPVTAETVRLFGWQAIVETDPEYLPAMWRKTYAQARELVATRVKAGDLRLSLPESTSLRRLKAVS